MQRVVICSFPMHRYIRTESSFCFPLLPFARIFSMIMHNDLVFLSAGRG